MKHKNRPLLFVTIAVAGLAAGTAHAETREPAPSPPKPVCGCLKAGNAKAPPCPPECVVKGAARTKGADGEAVRDRSSAAKREDDKKK
jgi:hypothetical protein